MARNTAQKPTQPTTAQPQAESSRNAHTASRGGPTHEQIARRAYEIYLARGGMPGSPEQDWHQAERELKLGRQ
jgi:hypothetical protein